MIWTVSVRSINWNELLSVICLRSYELQIFSFSKLSISNMWCFFFVCYTFYYFVVTFSICPSLPNWLVKTSPTICCWSETSPRGNKTLLNFRLKSNPHELYIWKGCFVWLSWKYSISILANSRSIVAKVFQIVLKPPFEVQSHVLNFGP